MATTSSRAKPVKRADERVIASRRRDVRAINRRFNARDAARDEAAAERDRVIRDAHADGVTPTELAEDTGLTTKRIDQIVRAGGL